MWLELLIHTARRDAASRPYALLLAMGWATAAALASLGDTFAAAVTAVNMAALVASLIAAVASTYSAAADREYAAGLYMAAMGRGRYFAARLLASLALSLAAAMAVLAPYIILRGNHAAALSAALAAAASSIMGTGIGLAARDRDRAMLLTVAAWTFLALAYDLVTAFAALLLSLADVHVLALQLLDYIKVSTYAGLAALDPHMLTLGPPGRLLWQNPEAIPAAYAAWTAALLLASYDAYRRADL